MNNDTTQMISFDLDLAYEEEGIDEGLAAFLAEVPFVTEATVLLASGPGGGWPLVRFTFPADKLGAFAEAYGIDEEELTELL